MSYEDARIAICGHFKDRWEASAYAAVPVWYPNQKFNLVHGPYVALAIVGTGGDAASIGSPGAVLDRLTGFVQADIVVDENTGEAAALKMADVIAGIFRRAELSHGASGNIVFGVVPEPVRLPGGGMCRFALRAPYRRDVIQ